MGRPDLRGESVDNLRTSQRSRDVNAAATVTMHDVPMGNIFVVMKMVLLENYIILSNFLFKLKHS